MAEYKTQQIMVKVDGSGMCDKYKRLQNDQIPKNIQAPVAT